MIDMQVPVSKFLAAWLPSLAISSVVPGTGLADAGSVDFYGVTVPAVTCVLGFLGVILARPLARQSKNPGGEAQLSWPLFLLVSAIMLILVELWIIESRPGWLFAFVVAIGLGFSGYSLIELAGEQARDFLRNAMARARETLGNTPPKPQDDGPDQ